MICKISNYLQLRLVVMAMAHDMCAIYRVYDGIYCNGIDEP